jgi:hypothetical protein
MKIPEFTAEASLYRTTGRYRVSASDFGVSPPSEAIVPAYLPGPETQARCNSCMEKCADRAAYCNAAAMAPLAGCVFPPACPVAAATAGGLLAGCQTALLGCAATCSLPRPELFGLKLLGESPCCPKVCGFTHPFAMGEGCCDEGEHCVDRFDPNARQGCCPSDQSVCGGKCCAKGDRCCGNECCPAGWFCSDGVCTQSVPFPSEPPPEPPEPPMHLEICPLGWTPCKGGCCAPGLECCPNGVCSWTCVK